MTEVSKYRRQGATAFADNEPRHSCRYKAVDIIREWQAGWDGAAALSNAASPPTGMLDLAAVRALDALPEYLERFTEDCDLENREHRRHVGDLLALAAERGDLDMVRTIATCLVCS
jgi:hypothetical protein